MLRLCHACVPSAMAYSCEISLCVVHEMHYAVHRMHRFILRRPISISMHLLSLCHLPSTLYKNTHIQNEHERAVKCIWIILCIHNMKREQKKFSGSLFDALFLSACLATNAFFRCLVKFSFSLALQTVFTCSHFFSLSISMCNSPPQGLVSFAFRTGSCASVLMCVYVPTFGIFQQVYC